MLSNICDCKNFTFDPLKNSKVQVDNYSDKMVSGHTQTHGRSPFLITLHNTKSHICTERLVSVKERERERECVHVCTNMLSCLWGGVTSSLFLQILGEEKPNNTVIHLRLVYKWLLQNNVIQTINH
jgi:hypothetical protein